MPSDAADRSRAERLIPGLIEQALVAPPFRLAFPRDLEEHFEKETGVTRCRQLSWVIIICLCLYDLFVIDDFNLVPDIAPWAAGIRLGVMTPIGLALAWFVRRKPPQFLRESSLTLVALLCSISITVFFSFSRAPGAPHYLYGLILVVIFSNVLLPLRFPYALFSSLTNLLVLSFGLAHTAIRPEVWLNAISFMVVSIILSLIANYRLERELRRAYLVNLREQYRGSSLSEINRRLEDLSNQDVLTGLANRRFLERHLAEAWRRSLMRQEHLGLLMLDVDLFKAFNDNHGHQAGDEALRTVAATLREYVRGKMDLVVRYGGEEFVVVLPSQDLWACMSIAERIRRAIEATSLTKSTGLAETITVSIGAASALATNSSTPATLIADADAALYMAKQLGRNRVWPPLVPAQHPVPEAAE